MFFSLTASSIGSFLVGAQRYLKGLVLQSLICGLMHYNCLICHALGSIMVVTTTVLFSTVITTINNFVTYSVRAHVVSSKFGLLFRFFIHFHFIVVLGIETARRRLILEGLHLVLLLVVGHSSGAC